ncbi:MAG: hypothetical protein Q4P11_04790 [Methanobrevibacter sp.]|nr:hypothetical protein [Methanobrevibacter sp.]
MAKQSQKSEQITPSLSVVYDYDQTMRKTIDFETAFREALGNIEVIKYENHNIYKYTHNNLDTYFLTGAITWLNKPHPLFKKRLQLKKWYKEFYDEYIHKENTDVRIVGVYRYEGMHIFVEFAAKDYMENKLNSSSAHVYSNDLYQALTNDYFRKQDQNGNTITTISSKNFKKYIDGNIKENSIFNLFNKFNKDFFFGEWITAESAIEVMKSKNWYQWKGTEWAGWFLEYEANEFLEKEECPNIMLYIGDKKTEDLLDFDLYFENDDFYGDLKASDINKNEIILNDQINTLDAINDKGKLWYVIYEHETKKDTDYGSVMAKARMKLMGTPYKEGGKISYKDRMKHSVNFKKMEILELNRINMHEILRTFNQGRNSDGNDRKPKFKIDKKNIDNFTIYSYHV